MDQRKERAQKLTLLAGDLLALAVVTLYGFASHDTLLTAGTHMLTTFLPLAVSWLLVGPHLGVYNVQRSTDWRQLWRPFWAMVLAGPLAAWMRAVLLGSTPILPLFVVVLGGFAALGLLAWRLLYWLVVRRKPVARLTGENISTP